MATFGALIADYIGTFANTDLMDLTLTGGARIVVDKLADEADDRLDVYATEKTDAGSGIAITAGRVIKAHKSGYGASRINQVDKSKYGLSTSIYNTATTDPVWYLEKTKAYVLPSGGTLVWVAYPTVASTDATISNFPPEGYPVIVLYSAVHCQLSIISTLIVTTMGGSAFANPTNVTPPSAPSFTYTDATATTVGLSAVDATTLSASTTLSVGSTLTFTPPVFGGSYTNIDTALGNSDVEWASGYSDKIKAQLNQYDIDLKNALSDFNKEAKQFETDLQEAIAQAQITSQETIRQAGITLEEAKVQAGIDAQREGKQAELTQNLKLQNELNDYRQDVEEYQADLGKYQADIQDFVAQVNEAAQDLSAETQKNSAMLQGHLALADKLKQEYVEALGVL